MALATLEKADGTTKSARMPTPTRITQLSAWYKAARTVVPEIPDVKNTPWYIADTEVTVDFIKYHLLDGIGGKAVVTIERNKGKFGS